MNVVEPEISVANKNHIWTETYVSIQLTLVNTSGSLVPAGK